MPSTLGPWGLVGRSEVPGPYSDQGLATVRPGSGPTRIDYTGTMDVTSRLRAQGWDHVGDPDGWNGWLVTPFQGAPDAPAKMFQVTAPDGTTTRSVHPLAPGEESSNSFAAVTPDGMWTVSAEWGAVSRLLVFATPGVNPSSPVGSPLPLAGTIRLRQPLTDLQGCAFETAVALVCTDARDVVQIELDAPIGPDHTVVGSARTLGAVPETGGCPGYFEPEGVDVDRGLGQLRIAVSQPGICNVLTQVYEYRRPPAGSV